MIIIPIGSMVRMIQGDIWGRPMEGEDFPGMYATVVITAHEFGHFLTFEIYEWFALQGVNIHLAEPPNVELLADCIAGEFMDTFNGGADVGFTSTDVQNMVTALGLIADPSPNSGTHGTADQRGLAFLRGYSAQPDPYGAPAPPANQSSDTGKRLCFDTYGP
jgi:predicted metalloprotease